MPRRETVETFVNFVEGGRFLEAIERYYADDVTVRENGAPPQRGRDAYMERERDTLAAFKSVIAQRTRSVVIDGDDVAICWRFEFTPEQGKRLVLEEVALQTWEAGQIVAEQFFYDPKQLGATTIGMPAS